MKTKLIKFGIYALSVSLFAVLSFIASMAIFSIIVPDPCDYHSIDDAEITWLFKLFYGPFPGEAGHAGPGFFNLFFSLSVGALLGIIVSIYVIKIIFKKRNNEVSEVLDKFE